MARYGLTIFCGALLLFQVQPIIARYVLPWYGGSAAVWTTSMLVFQVLLLAGYGYAHWLASRFDARAQIRVHLVLILISLAFFPITPSAALEPADPLHPTGAVIWLLLVTVGLPYLILAASSPLLQHWSSRTHPTGHTYRLFALSNLGSVLGLLLYPFVTEPLTGLATQSVAWSVGYGVYLLAWAWCAAHVWRSNVARVLVPMTRVSEPAPAWRERVLWIALAACGSVVLLATTNQLSQDVAVVPLLWVLPLTLYLLTFVVCFDRERWYDRRLWGPLLVLVLLSGMLRLHESLPLILTILVHSLTLAACCMVCHGELARLKPPASRLTSFYLMVVLGGALGGAFVALVAPVVFTRYAEYQTGLVGSYVLFGICALGRRGYVAAFKRYAGWAWAVGMALLMVAPVESLGRTRAGVVTASRSFYGVVTVRDQDVGVDEPVPIRSLWNGRILHGAELQGAEFGSKPLLYYAPDTGVGVTIDVMRRLAERPEHPSRGPDGMRVGVIGLGVGALAGYGRAGDTFRFYEINPDVVAIAHRYFSYLEDTPAATDVVLGDARLSLERELRTGGSQDFDVLVVDAFSGDAIPVHLLTREAFALYRRHLSRDGVLAVHVSNRHLDLTSVAMGVARSLDLTPLWLPNPTSNRTGALESQWVVATSNGRFLTHYRIAELARPWRPNPSQVIWTDDYSNLLLPLMRKQAARWSDATAD